MTEDESAPLLDFLNRHSQRPEFQIRFRWRKGSLALWDNRSTQHIAVNDYAGYRRVMDRVPIAGGPADFREMRRQGWPLTRGGAGPRSGAPGGWLSAGRGRRGR